MIRLSEERARLAKRDKITLTLFPARRERVRNPVTGVEEMRPVLPRSLYASAIVPLRDVAGGAHGRVRVRLRFLKPIRDIGLIQSDWLELAGFEDMAAFRDWWLETHDREWCERGFGAGARFERFETRWAPRTVVVVKFTTAVDIPRHLSPAGKAPKGMREDGTAESMAEHGYGLSAGLVPMYSEDGTLYPEPEAVDPDTIEPLWNEVARAKLAASRSEEHTLRERRRLAEELKRAPLRSGVDEGLAVIRRALESMKEDRAA